MNDEISFVENIMRHTCWNNSEQVAFCEREIMEGL